MSAFHEVQGCNSVTKTSDISNMKYRLNVSCKYKTPMALCNLSHFKDILSRSSHHFWNVWCPLQAPGMQAVLTVPSVFLWIPARRQWLLLRDEPCWMPQHKRQVLGAHLSSACLWLNAAAEQSTRCHCSSTANCLLEHFLGQECKVAVGSKGL